MTKLIRVVFIGAQGLNILQMENEKFAYIIVKGSASLFQSPFFHLVPNIHNPGFQQSPGLPENST